MTITLFHVSDLHFGAEDKAALAWFADAVAHEKPDAVICTGDITQRGTVAEFAAAERWLAGLGVPVSVEPGNHDMPYYSEMTERLRRPYARFEAFRANVYSRAVHREIDLPGVTLVPLRTITPAQWRLNWSKGYVARRALADALAALHGVSGLRLVACHHPLVGAKMLGSGMTRGGKAALAALAAAGVDAVLTGHVHDPFDITREAGGHPIRMIGAGTLSARLRRTAPSYNRLEWSDAGLTVLAEYLR